MWHLALFWCDTWPYFDVTPGRILMWHGGGSRVLLTRCAWGHGRATFQSLCLAPNHSPYIPTNASGLSLRWYNAHRRWHPISHFRSYYRHRHKSASISCREARSPIRLSSDVGVSASPSRAPRCYASRFLLLARQSQSELCLCACFVRRFSIRWELSSGVLRKS